MPEELIFTKTLRLKADLSTLRQSALSSSGAFVLADPVDVPFAPRVKLMNALETVEQFNPQISMSMTCGLSKFKADDSVPTPEDSGILT
jgi:hypothetical protein